MPDRMLLKQVASILIMAQINLRIRVEEYELLELVAKREGTPITSLFKTVISAGFREWKVKQVFDLYSRGEIGFKKTLYLSGFTPFEFMDYVENNEIEPPHSELMEKRCEEIAASLKTEDLFKDPRYKRKITPDRPNITEE